MNNDKWNMFKNYMHNELGITKEDISNWVAESVTIQAKKALSECNINDRIDTLINKKIDDAIKDRSIYRNNSFNDEIISRISRDLASTLRLTINQ